MGLAKIIAVLGDARYTVQIDSGEYDRLAQISATDALRITLTERATEIEFKINAAKIEEAIARANTVAAMNILIEELAADPTSAASEAAMKEYQRLLQEQLKIEAKSVPLRQVHMSLKVQIAIAAKKLTSLSGLTAVLVKNVWCTTFHPELALNTAVATVDIPGDTSLTLVAPAGRLWAAADGLMYSRELLTPAQVYFNAAIFPGWQIDKPTYRWGTLLGINWTANTGTVALGDALSTGQRLDANKQSVLYNVPIVYMKSNARAFDPDSRVVVDLRAGWDAPKVIGFLDNPRPDAPSLNTGTGGVLLKHGRVWSLDFQPGKSSPDYTGAKHKIEMLSGSLPPGLSLTGDCVISGVPNSPGVYAFRLRTIDEFTTAENHRYVDGGTCTWYVTDGYQNMGGYFIDAENAVVKQGDNVATNAESPSVQVSFFVPPGALLGCTVQKTIYPSVIDGSSAAIYTNYAPAFVDYLGYGTPYDEHRYRVIWGPYWNGAFEDDPSQGANKSGGGGDTGWSLPGGGWPPIEPPADTGINPMTLPYGFDQDPLAANFKQKSGTCVFLIGGVDYDGSIVLVSTLSVSARVSKYY